MTGTHRFMRFDDRFSAIVLAVSLLTYTAALTIHGSPASASATNGRIGFSSERSGQFQLYSMLPDGSDVQVLTSPGANHLDWSPDGAKLVYEQSGTLYVADADGDGAVAITAGFRPAWSPDGLHLAFALGSDIWKIPVDGSTPPVQLTMDGSACSDDSPAWSPDGSKIAFQGCVAGDPEIVVMDASGGAATPLTDSPGIDWYPAWSPDGSQLAFTTHRDGDPEIYVMDADGSDQIRLTDSSGADEFPSWSPDGTRIAFASTRDGDFDIYAMDTVDPGIVTQLTDSAGRDFFPDWQPVSGTTYGLEVAVDGTGAGTVTSEPGGIDCGSDCSQDFEPGIDVILTASPDAGSSVTGWTVPGCSGQTCTLTMDQSQMVGVTFTATPPPETHVLTVQFDIETGIAVPEGHVTSSPAGIVDCTETCSVSLPEGTTLSLSATADPGFFTGWSGEGCKGFLTCSVTLDQDRTVTALFSWISAVVLTQQVSIAGTGSGQVSSQPEGIACPSVCQAEFTLGDTVTLTAEASPGSTFNRWMGACEKTETGCTVLIDGAQEPATALFDATIHTLDVTVEGTGSGTVSSDPVGIDCGTTCSALFNAGDQVTLTAVPDADSSVTAWSEPGCSVEACTVTMDKARSVRVTLARDTNDLDVVIEGTGSGSVRSDHLGIVCPSDCSEAYEAGTTVALSAEPDPGSTFTGWSEVDCTGTDPCTLSMDQARLVTATFTLDEVNSAPSAFSQSVTTNEDQSVQITLAGEDPDGDPLTCEVWYVPEGSSLDGCILTWRPYPDVSGTDRIYFRVDDGALVSDWAEVTIEVFPVADAPRLDVVSVSATTEGEMTYYTIYFRDPDGQPASDFVGSVNWGDGKSSSSLDAESYHYDLYYFSVSHVYERFGKYTQTLAVRDAAGLDSYKRGQNVQDAWIDAADQAGGRAIAGRAWPPGGVMGCVYDSNPDGLASDLTVSVKWGDGTASTGGVVANTKKNDPNDVCGTGWDFVVRASHTYAKVGCYRFTYTVKSKGGARATGRHVDCLTVS